MSQRVLKINNFYSNAKSLRGFFEKQFINPHQASEKRFVWDYWNVNKQYRLIRTPAYYYFPENLYSKWHQSLVDWGRRNLGCHDISPPWMSYYVDGCYQKLHVDIPHGPWAFVYSLTPKQRKFRGGDTLILKDKVLNYWNEQSLGSTFESEDIFENVTPDFNRLTVFDPRLPHGVDEVRGVEDPLQARLVIHGWFVEPRPFTDGLLNVNEVGEDLADVVYNISNKINQLGSFHGAVCLRLHVDANGKVQRLVWLTNTLRELNFNNVSTTSLKKVIGKTILEQKFRSKKKTKLNSSTQITLPLVFKI